MYTKYGKVQWFIATARLIDFSHNNCMYTWSNFQTNAIMVKLDRFLASSSWETKYPKSICSGKFSNLRPYSYMSQLAPPGWGLFLFKFYRSWFLLEGFDNFIKLCISSFVSSANPIDSLSYKLKEIKKSIKNWIPEQSSNWSSRLQEIEVSIQGIDI